MTERILPREVTVSDTGHRLVHVFCHVCNGLEPGTTPPLGVPMTSVCRQCTRIVSAKRFQAQTCVVCADITGTGRCLSGHKLRSLEEMERDD